jgi:hypothetical protein
MSGIVYKLVSEKDKAAFETKLKDAVAAGFPTVASQRTIVDLKNIPVYIAIVSNP